MDARLKKYSIVLFGKKTSISLEPAFWTALHDIAVERDVSIAELLRQISTKGEGANLSSSCRLYVLAHVKAQAAQQQRKVA